MNRKTVLALVLTVLLIVVLEILVDAAVNIAPRAITNQSYDILIVDDANKYAFFGWYRASMMPSKGWDLLQRTIDWADDNIPPTETDIVLFTYDGTLGNEDAFAVYTYLIGQGYTGIALVAQNEAAKLPPSYYLDFDLVLYWNTYGYDASNIVSSGIPFITVSTMQTDEMGIGTGSETMHELRNTFYVANNSYYPTQMYLLGMLYFESEMWTDATEAIDNGIALVNVSIAVPPPDTEPNIIRVPQNYSSIQTAADVANPGDIILVGTGTYKENIILNKSVSISGENRSGTIVDGTIYVIAYNVNISGFTVLGGGVKVYTAGNTINNNLIVNCGWGMELKTPGHNTVSGNIITNNQYGIVLSHSVGNFIHDNDVTNSVQYGIGLWGSSNDNKINNNHITGSSAWGIGFRDSHYNLVESNTITNNAYGIDFISSINNRIYHNNLIDNTINHVSGSLDNIWDNGYPSGGNYWSDYAGTDDFWGENQDFKGYDMIGDTAYVIDEDKIDNYPLITPWRECKPPITEFPDLNGDGQVNILDVSTVALHFGKEFEDP